MPILKHVIKVLMIILTVMVMMFVCAFIGVIIGYTIIGNGNAGDVFSMDIWDHIMSFVR